MTKQRQPRLGEVVYPGCGRMCGCLFSTESHPAAVCVECPRMWRMERKAPAGARTKGENRV